MGTKLHTSTSTTRTFYRAILPLLVALSLLASQLTPFGLMPADAAVVGGGTDGLGFEIDGNFVVDSSKDWANVSPVVLVDPVVNGIDQSIYLGSNKENDDRSTWTVGPGQPSPGKNDLTVAYLDFETAGDEYWLRLGAERAAGNGDAWFSFELNQDTDGPYVPGTNLPAAPSTGDLRISFLFPGNATTSPQVIVYEWSGTSWIDIDNVEAFAAANDVPIPSLHFGTELGLREFMEVSLDVGFLFGLDAPCRSFGSTWARTRTSNSESAELTDVVGPIDFGFNTCADLTLRKVDTDGNGQAGVEFDLYEGS
jgi:hypothetical protein